MDRIIKSQAATISSLNTDLERVIREKDEQAATTKSQISSLQQRFGRFFSVEMSKEGPGILAQLKDKQKTPFDRLFVASQSSMDIYSLLVPKTNDCLSTTNIGGFFIDFELETAVMIRGVKIFSTNSSFPKSFDITVEGNC